MTEDSGTGLDYPTIDTLFRHNLWANTRLFALCAELSDEALDASTVGAFGTIRETAEHIAGAETSYWRRIVTGQPYRRPEGAPPPTWAELQASIRESGAGLIEAAPTVQATDFLEISWDSEPRSVPVAIVLTQVINHATEHRAQIMTMLTQLGIQPPDLDGWTYFATCEGAG
jgi:uncharacterized damage-inducible protein DinB